MKDKNLIGQLFRCTFVAVTFFAVDFALRFFTRWLGYYSIFELAPSLFSICWIGIFVTFLSLFPRRAGRIVYAVWYGIWSFYTIAQYTYYLIFDKFFFLSDMSNAYEGTAYLGFVLDSLDIPVIAMSIIFLCLCILAFLLFPDFKFLGRQLTRHILRGTIFAASCIGIAVIPNLYTGNADAQFFSSKYEYGQFTNSSFDLELTGLYQYIARDTWVTYLKPRESQESLHSQVNTYLGAKSNHTTNAMTGSLVGKNVILVQMESLDDWIINQENTPTIFRLMNEGINFTNMYTCIYGSGSTFSTEFAFNAGIYQSTTGTAAYSSIRSSFPFSLANTFRSLGYTTQSFHQNVGNYYNRSFMHEALGYSAYYCTRDYLSPELIPEADASIITDDTCWELLTRQSPFFSFIISYSAHVPYNSKDTLSTYALKLHPEYDDPRRTDELNCLYAKARLTDDMFMALLERLSEDDLLKSTVIIAYDDHYNYGISDKVLIQQLSEANGSSILERTPAFIWYEGCDTLEVTKICQTIDWVPTIANLFGIDVTPYVLGNDIFDDAYAGWAIFPNGTWLTEDAYAVNGIPRWNNGMTEEEIAEMNAFVETFYNANEAILASDYYAQ